MGGLFVSPLAACPRRRPELMDITELTNVLLYEEASDDETEGWTLVKIGNRRFWMQWTWDGESDYYDVRMQSF